jgi:hypothetical protein
MSDAHAFVREALAQKIPKAKIRQVLAEAGWSEAEVMSALEQYMDVEFPLPVPKRRPYVSAREAFVYLVTFLCLYISAYHFGKLLFSFIDLAVKDVLNANEIVSPKDVRLSLAALIIAFPLYVWLTVRMAKKVSNDPEMKDSMVRKWLTYVTLFFTTGAIITVLISLFYNMLNGELTLRFLLKVLVVLFIAASIFGYYLIPKITKKVFSERVFIGIIIATTATAVLIGFFINRSPFQERMMKVDEQRTYDLQRIVGAVDFFYLQNRRLPVSLDEITDRYGADVVRSTNDPLSGEPYEYRATGDFSYEVCATFNFPSPVAERFPRIYAGTLRIPPSITAGPWQHAAGRACFSFQEDQGIR